ncbi:MAG: hypothetical protein U0271_09795 [Polyangiaceae bacterium]
MEHLLMLSFRRFSPRARRVFTSVARAIALSGAVAAGSACHEPLDTSRPPAVIATFGDDLYGVMCDRLAADLFQEDVTGASYQAVCHYDDTGAYGDEIDESVLPAPSNNAAKEARRISLAKMAALVRRRSDLVKAFNAVFPDVDIDDPTTEDTSDKVNLLTAMMDLSQHLSILYEEDPYNDGPVGTNGLAPQATEGLGAVFDSMGKSDDAKAMLTRMWARRGYRPANVGLGIVRPSLDYPNLRDFTTNAVTLLGPDGAAEWQLKGLLAVMKQEMAYMKPEIAGLPELVVDNAKAQPNRPRTTIELLRELMLTEDDAFAPTPEEPARYIALRDRRGYVVPASAATIFSDSDGDGYADVDGFGRFVDAGGSPITVDTPFLIPGIEPLASVDEYGRPSGDVYRYVDTSRTPAASLSSVLAPLLDATQYATPGDPEAYKSEYETLMYALAGATVLLGDRADAEYDFDQDKVVPPGTNCESCMEYSRFRGENSPLVDLAYAAGQLLADKDSDALLLGLIDLLENHENEVARVLAAALRVKEISNEHDALAAQGQLPAAGLPYENPLWDQAAQVISQIAESPGLLDDLLGALADPVVVTPIGGSQHMGETLSLFASTRDGMTYDQNDLNGPALNTTDGGFSTADPHNPVDWNAARTGTNRSILEKSVQLIHDAAYARTCNKDGAVVKAALGPFTIDWPITGSYGQCELLEINDLAVLYFGAVLDPSHPKRTEFVLKDGTLNDIMDFLGVFGANEDDLMQQSSGIDGLTTHPGPSALNRLVFFGTDSDVYGGMPDRDFTNAGSTTDEFVFGLMEPAATSVCTGITCSSVNDTMRIRLRNSIFTWERRGFLDYLRPVITAFVNVSCSDDVTICDKTDFTGEHMFLDLADVFWSHYEGSDHGPECSTTVAKTDRRYCSGAGLNRYEPILDKALRTDMIPALHEFAVAVHDLSQVTIQRGPKAGQTLTGSQIMEMTARILLSQDYAASVGMKDRAGQKTANWVDGTVQSQVTPFNMFADAFHKMDTMFDAIEDGALRKALWRRARSQIVDVFLATEGTGSGTHFKIRGTGPLLKTTLRLVREQLNAHCPDRENGVPCTWAKDGLAQSLADTLSSPLVAAMIDLLEKVRQDENGRRALERFATYLLENTSGDALQATLASMVDAMQVLADDEKLVPIMKAASVALEPDRGAADTTIKMLKALSSDEYDRYHVLDTVLGNLVRPLPGDDGQPGLSPLEVMMETISEVNREDPTDPIAPLDSTDYGNIMNVVRDFMLSKTRGLEQIYDIVRKRKRK